MVTCECVGTSSICQREPLSTFVFSFTFSLKRPKRLIIIMSNEVSHCRYVAQTDFVHAAIGYHAPTGCTLYTSADEFFI
jgi:hypothetical protein